MNRPLSSVFYKEELNWFKKQFLSQPDITINAGSYFELLGIRRKLNFFICCPMWLAYNIFNFAIAGIVTEIFNILSVALSWYRFFANKKHS